LLGSFPPYYDSQTTLAALSVTTGLISKLTDILEEVQPRIRKYQVAIKDARKIVDQRRKEGDEDYGREFWTDIVFPDVSGLRKCFGWAVHHREITPDCSRGIDDL
jgi:hypothetical protein